MKQYLKGLLVAGVPAALGILFGLGVIFYSMNHSHTTEEASAEGGAKQEQTAASGNTDSAIKQLVSSNCAGCHGADLKGKVGPQLVGTKLSEEEIVKILKEGKGSMMPGNLAAGKEAEVAKYLKSLK
jgi:mono/diheme cytochrome c family protein